MKRLLLLLSISLLLITNFANAEPRIWTLSNLNPDGGGTPIPEGPSGGILTGTFSVHLVLDEDGDGPDPVQETGQDIGMPGDDDQLIMIAVQTAPSDFINPPGVFTIFLTYDLVDLGVAEDASFYIRVFEQQNLILGTRYVNSLSFPMPEYPANAQTVVELPERMLGYIGNGSPSWSYLPATRVHRLVIS